MTKVIDLTARTTGVHWRRTFDEGDESLPSDMLSLVVPADMEPQVSDLKAGGTDADEAIILVWHHGYPRAFLGRVFRCVEQVRQVDRTGTAERFYEAEVQLHTDRR